VTHPNIRHPWHLLPPRNWSDWAADHLVALIGTAACLWFFLVVPLAALLFPPWVQQVVFFLASGWVQLWALSAIVYGQNKADRKRDAKADADHDALVHLATRQDDTHRLTTALCDNLGIDPETGQTRLPRPRA
jgi:hypothetical protein